MKKKIIWGIVILITLIAATVIIWKDRKKEWQYQNCPEWINCMPPGGCGRIPTGCEGYTDIVS